MKTLVAEYIYKKFFKQRIKILDINNCPHYFQQVPTPPGPKDSGPKRHMKRDQRVQRASWELKDHFVFRSHRWPFNNKRLCSPPPSSRPRHQTERQSAHQERDHCVGFLGDLCGGRGSAVFPVIMTLKCSFDSSLVFPDCWDGWGC